MNGGNGSATFEVLELAARLSAVEHAQGRHAHDWSGQESRLDRLSEALRTTNDGLAELQRQLSNIIDQLRHLSVYVPQLARQKEARIALARRKPKRGK